MVLLEAMAAQLPIATTSNGGAGEVIGEAGFDFDVGDSDTLAALLARLRTLDSAALAELRQRMDERLYRLFSDAKARDAFWKVPAMRDALQLSQR
jgi:glycosyltransferase involved in cell wall biosynthesis